MSNVGGVGNGSSRGQGNLFDAARDLIDLPRAFAQDPQQALTQASTAVGHILSSADSLLHHNAEILGIVGTISGNPSLAALAVAEDATMKLLGNYAVRALSSRLPMPLAVAVGAGVNAGLRGGFRSAAEAVLATEGSPVNKASAFLKALFEAAVKPGAKAAVAHQTDAEKMAASAATIQTSVAKLAEVMASAAAGDTERAAGSAGLVHGIAETLGTHPSDRAATTDYANSNADGLFGGTVTVH
ncbi:MAG: hypothetical protein ACKVPX_19025 [Myxococcaceae bacterium]